LFKPKALCQLFLHEALSPSRSQVTSDGKDDFLDATVKYYEMDGEFFELNGNQTSLSPQEYQILVIFSN